MRRFQEGRAFFTPSEEVPAALAKRLRRRGWDYKPASPGLGQQRGGHWTPPGYGVIPPAAKDNSHGKYWS